MYLWLLGNYYEEYDYNLKVYALGESTEGITKLEDIEECYTLYKAEKEQMLRIYDKSKIVENEYIFKEEESEYQSIVVLGLSDDVFKKYAKKIGANYDKIKDSGVLIDDYEMYYEEDGKYNKTKVRTFNYEEGDTIVSKYGESYEEGVGEDSKVSFKNDREIRIKVGAVTDIRPYGREQNYYFGGGYLVVNVDRFKEIDFDVDVISIKSSNPDRLEMNIKKMNSLLNIVNIDKDAREQNSMVLVVKIFLYGFIGVITLIGVTNIFNTITSNMELRQKEFAMLKSIGMTRKEFNRMINLETIFYGSKALLYGITIGVFGAFMLFKAFEGDIIKEFTLPVSAIAISTVSVFALIFIIMKYSVGKINKQNTIETIRKDNI